MPSSVLIEDEQLEKQLISFVFMVTRFSTENYFTEYR